MKLKKLRYTIWNNNLVNIYLICDNNISKISQVFAMSLFDWKIFSISCSR